MSEIKSTLDLVLEKTKHLSLSEEEKAGQQRETYQQHLKGLLQKYADGLLTSDSFQDQLKTMQEQLNFNDEKLLISQILIHVDPDQDNTHWLDLLDVYRPNLRIPLQEILAVYAQRRETISQSNIQHHMDQLKSERQIHGSAVLPNLFGDREFQEKLTILRQETLTNIAALH